MEFCFCCASDLTIFNRPLLSRYKTADGKELCKSCFGALKERSAPIASDLLGVYSDQVLKVMKGSFNYSVANAPQNNTTTGNTTNITTNTGEMGKKPNNTMTEKKTIDPATGAETTEKTETINNPDGSVTHRTSKVTTNSKTTGNIDLESFFGKDSLMNKMLNQHLNLNSDNINTSNNSMANDSVDDTMDDLEKLVQMKEKGLLTDEEFATMKKRLIGGN